MNALSPETTLPLGLDKVRELKSHLIKGARLAAYCILHVIFRSVASGASKT